MSPCCHSYPYPLLEQRGPSAQALAVQSLLSGTTAGSKGLSQLLRLSGGTSGGCGQHNGFIIEPWKYSLFSTIPLGLCPSRNAHPISLASQPSLSIQILSKCRILRKCFLKTPLEAHLIHQGIPIHSGCVCPHPEGGDCGLARAQHRADAAPLAGENILTRDPHTRVQVPTLSFIDCVTPPSLGLSGAQFTHQ